MDKRDIFNVGSDIMEAVNDAVNNGDYSGLNETLRNVTGSAAGTAADALYNLQGRLQNGGSGAGGSGSYAGAPGGTTSGSSQGAGQRTYGHAGYASGNVTEEYMKRASGPAHHTKFSSRISPFLQRQVSRNSGIGRIVGGIVSLVCAGFAFIDTVMTGLLGAFFESGFFSASSLFLLIVTGALAILGGILIKTGQERKKLVREYYEYGRVAGTAEYLEISKLARAMGESRETVLNNLEKMMSEELLPAAWFDRQKTTLMLTERMYNEYLQLERERQEQEAAASLDQMKKDSSAADAAAAAAVDELPEDLRPRPEDAKLPPEARKIVEEGILYMGRIRAFNDEIGDEEVSAQLTQLETTMKRILDQIRKDPSSAPNLRRLMVYYLPTTMKLLQAYKELDSQTFQGENIVSTRHEIRDALGTINVAFENLLDSLFQDMAWDISSDISVMKTMMAQDGLTGDRIRKAAQGSAQPSAQPAGQADSGTEYTEGYTEGYSETGSGSAAAAAAQPAASEEQEQGIRLTFGE